MKKLVDGIKLYHGSYSIVEKPNLEMCAPNKDFGQGFYLTSSKIQARSFARNSINKAKKKGIIINERKAYISCFSFYGVDDLDVFYFNTADVEWLHCIVSHRMEGVFPEIRKSMRKLDVISGKIANDNTNATIVAYLGRVFGEVGTQQADNMCISLLIPERLQDQFCFRTEKAISKLSFIEYETVSLE